MDFFISNREKYGNRAGLFGHKSASKSNPSSPPHPTEGRSSPPVSYYGIKRSESEYAFPISDNHTTHWKQQQQHASERVPNSHHRPPVYRYSTPERPRENGKERTEAIFYEPDADVTPRSEASLSPFRSARTRTPDRRRRSTDFSRELHERMHETEANVSPFHPSRSRSPAPNNTQEFRGRDYSRERYEAEGHLTSQRSAPSSPFHPSRSPPHTRATLQPERYNKGKDHYEADADVTPRSSPPMSPFHGATSRYPPPPFYSSSDDDEDNHSTTYLFPEISTGHRSRGVSGSSTPNNDVQPVHYKYQMATAETYEQDRQFEPPELPDESESFTMQEITKMRGLESYEEETQSDAYVSVANYKVRHCVSATLQAIMDKHGDIAASSKLQSTSTRSFYLESLAAAVTELKSTALRDLSKTRVAEIAAVVKDMDSVRIDVSWLKTAVEELAEAVECFGGYEAAKMEKEECSKGMKEGKVEMEELRDELKRREKEMKECRERVTAMAGRLGQLEMKDSWVTKKLELFQSKVHKFDGEAVFVEV
ncbi:uncharacterized protein LOC125595909 isoform X2 [Brassica napus]|uniref:uncharacterized protein LOC125578548 isoform X2 n=1 Tax=Brassica napus TaxID=3708 RepID=UPI0020791C07|nr:uncharacterized protein LOC125578548 isoform X2 [Brassica napus]XP_048627247.1 uncharacterized protein LOC125595909 isoform X2 [Brassica napus]